MTRSRYAAVVLAALMLACSSEATRAPSLLADFAQAARDAGTVAFTATQSFTFDDDGSPRTVEVTAEGRVDIRAEHGEMILDFGGWFEQFSASGGPSVPSRQRMLFFEDRGYLEITDEFRENDDRGEIPPNARWARIPLRGAALGTEGFDIFSPFPDPGAYFATLQEVSTKVEPKGPERIRGVTTTRYRVVVDLEAAQERAPEQSRRFYRQMREEIGDRLPMFVWIGDDDALLYRQRVQVDVQQSFTIQTEFFDYGEPVELREPSGDEVYEPEERSTRSTFSCTGSSIDGGSPDC